FSSKVIDKYCLNLSISDLIDLNNAHPNYRQLSLILARKLIAAEDLSDHLVLFQQLKLKYNFTNENLISGNLKNQY
mgnify:CR=1